MPTADFDTPSYIVDYEKFGTPLPKDSYGRAENDLPAIDLKNGHRLHAQAFGNPEGEPVIVLHGGPGGGCATDFLNIYDLSRFRVILFDQRGCGHSTPTTRTDLAAAMHGNNTAELVEDINAVRKHFGITGKAHIEGGSWGSTLALAYAAKHPDKVASLIVRGIFLGTKPGIQYLFQGNAASYKTADQRISDDSSPQDVETFLTHYDAQDYSKEGAYRAYVGAGDLPGQIPPEYHASHQHMRLAYARAWDDYVRTIPENERGDMVTAYCKRLEATADETLRGTGQYDAQSNRIDPDYQTHAARSFGQWEYAISYFSEKVQKNGKVDIFAEEEVPGELVDFARLEARYMRDGCYLSPDGSPTPGGSTYLIDQLPNIAKENIPMYIVHGKHDQVCPVRDAQLLASEYRKALEQAVPDATERAEVHFTPSEKAGHGRKEFTNAQALMKAIANVPEIPKAAHSSAIRSGGTKSPTP